LRFYTELSTDWLGGSRVLHSAARPLPCIFVAESLFAGEHAKASIPQALLASPCRHGKQVRTTVSRANGSHWRSVAASIELRESGRWKHYYTPEEFLEAMREASSSRDEWARLAGLEKGEASA
jgi:hypothetical protein